jgi:hypothetical protein
MTWRLFWTHVLLAAVVAGVLSATFRAMGLDVMDDLLIYLLGLFVGYRMAGLP